MKRKYLVFISSLTIVSVLLGSLFYYGMVQAQGPGDYDPWYDINDDGKIDMKDIGGVSRKFGTTGTSINKTALLLDLQERLDILNLSAIECHSRLLSLEEAVDLLQHEHDADILALQLGLTDLQAQLTSLATYVDGVVIGFTNDITALELGVTFAHDRIDDLTTRVTTLESRVDTLETSVAGLVDDLDGMKFGKSYSSGSDINPMVTTYSGYLWWDHSAKALIAVETNAYNGYWHAAGIRDQGSPSVPALFNTWIDDGESETMATLNTNGNWVTLDFTSEGPNAGYIRIHAYYANNKFVAHYSYRYQ